MLKSDKEKFYFITYRDQSNITKSKLENITKMNCKNLYAKIINYQIQRYGHYLCDEYTHLVNKKG